MSEPAAPPLKQTSLNAVHRRLGAKMVDFGGWDMPVQYSGLVDEHHTVRRAVGLFDVSHMGEIEIRGPQAFQLIDSLTPNAVSKLKHGQAQYSALLYEHGGFVDDILVHKVNDTHFFLCVNSSNQEKDYAHIVEHNKFDAETEFASDRYALLAIQGPRAPETLQKLTKTELAPIKYYHFVDGEVSGTPARIARTGYTGEVGFEIYIPTAEAPRIWDAVMEAGAEFGIKPAGLGARNTLRLEAAMALYGHEITASINPLEAGLSRIVKFEKGEFIGRQALLAQQEKGVQRLLTGFEMTGRGIGRDGYEITMDGQPAGWVTSGGPAPTLNKNIGMCYLPVAQTQPGKTIQIMIRSQPVDAVTRPIPFYKRANS
ncbi:MAG TPA: glycine cleavage system aminomethyltransferase GcvT [Bryobacteraceae bacterium]|nr:glycine cleavage system aminomethyltransferase GcvT [Bryobacteraceae bacterium]